MDSDVSPSMPPTPPKTAGRKKIKIQRIEDSRNRQVTFLKRKNGLLKKAMELGILCDCEVSVIIFNLNNGKLFEYSSVEPEKVLQKYATYSGPSERRRKDRFFELAASKGTSNIPLNEPQLAQAAMDAASAAVCRPRPVHKFKNAEGEPVEDQYYNGRKLSSGESPGNPLLPPVTPREDHSGNPELATTPAVVANPVPQRCTRATAIAFPSQNLQPLSAKPLLTGLTPRFGTDVPVPPLFTPHTANRQLSAAFDLPTMPSTPSTRVQDARYPPPQMRQALQSVRTAGLLPPPPSPPPPHKPTTTFQDKPGAQSTPASTGPTPRQPAPVTESTRNGLAATNEPMSARSRSPQSLPNTNRGNDKDTHDESTSNSAGLGNSGIHLNESGGKPRPRQRPNLTVFIPHPNREDPVSGTPSGLNPLSSPSSGSNPLPGLGSARFPSMSPTSHGMWPTWNPLASATDRDPGHVPLTPFLNMDGFCMAGDGNNTGFGSGPHFSLPSPTNAGLIPLTPRILGFDPLFSARTDGPPSVPAKRNFEHAFDDNIARNSKRKQ